MREFVPGCCYRQPLPAVPPAVVAGWLLAGSCGGCLQAAVLCWLCAGMPAATAAGRFVQV